MDDSVTISDSERYPDAWLARIKPELNPGERLLWAGEMGRGKRASGRVFAVVWGVGLAALSLVTMAGLFGLLGTTLARLDVLLGGTGIIAGVVSFFDLRWPPEFDFELGVESFSWRPSLYALTDERAISWTPSGRMLLVKSTYRGTVKTVSRLEAADGSGSIFCDVAPDPSGLGALFRDVPEVRRVEALVRTHLIGDDLRPTDS